MLLIWRLIVLSPRFFQLDVIIALSMASFLLEDADYLIQVFGILVICPDKMVLVSVGA